MPDFYALVDALPGQEHAVEESLRGVRGVLGVARCKEGSADFLVRFNAATFDVVDDFLQTYVRPLKGVKGVEVVQQWDEYSALVAEARAHLQRL